MARRFADWEIDELVNLEQQRRADERMADPSWIVAEDDLSPTLGGGVWRKIERED